MRKLIYIIVFLANNLDCYYSQNLILNPSFSDVNSKKDIKSCYIIANEKSSDVKYWYIPSYIKNKYRYPMVEYYSSRDKELKIKQRDFTNIDQLFDNNLGFVSLDINMVKGNALIQQKLVPITKGLYCFKFKYKRKLNRKRLIEFAFTPTDLKEFAAYRRVKTPLSLINISFEDTLVSDDNLPWIQKSYILKLNGNEQYLTIGDLSNKPLNNKNYVNYYIDDVELNQIVDSNECQCQIIDKDLSKLYSRNFPVNKTIKNDTLIMFAPYNTYRGINNLITPQAKEYLNSIISFMQRNPSMKIKFLEFKNGDSELLGSVYSYRDYINFFNISKNRISLSKGICNDSKSIYCKFGSEYVQIGFKFYYE